MSVNLPKNMDISQTYFTFKMARFFWELFDKEKSSEKKIYYLNASITFTKSIYNIFKNETVNDKSEKLSRIIAQVDANESLKILQNLRNLLLKEKAINPLISPVISFWCESDDYSDYKVFILGFLCDMKVKTRIINTRTGEVVPNVPKDFTYKMYYSMNGKIIDVSDILKKSIEFWNFTILDLTENSIIA